MEAFYLLSEYIKWDYKLKEKDFDAILHMLVFLALGFIINKFNKKKTEILNQMNK
ncbi:hypothetical protein EB1_17470 [Empedobacter brevis NBRC 14943 = ATCC 43319]|uniref:Uncharacterized protein n=1 Tax=Empedobacter brevis NBRC 14943 = ATCC 43319 TaxID=1218108 RepID=A0A511NH11_9FLAO|nr:hypothetical protein [Empedobacter brevis]GEM51957.1 hypothetical protein EB1_17470 [Empedobacter brevis NBRC 14943 = ATCC 43319]